MCHLMMGTLFGFRSVIVVRGLRGLPSVYDNILRRE